MFHSLKSLHRIYTYIDRYFFYAPLLGTIFIGISIYFKIKHSEDLVDTINICLNLFALAVFLFCYSLLVSTYFQKTPRDIKKRKTTAYILFALVYYTYGITGILVTTYYNIMIIIVLLVSLGMLRLVPGKKQTLLGSLFVLLYLVIVFAQEFGFIPDNPGQILYKNRGYFLMTVFSIKCVLLVYLNIAKYINLKLLQIENHYYPVKKKSTKKAGSVENSRTEIQIPGEHFNILTEREHEVARLLLRGLTYKAIGTDLGISINTVQSHIKSIYGKYVINSRTDLYRLCKEGVITSGPPKSL